MFSNEVQKSSLKKYLSWKNGFLLFLLPFISCNIGTVEYCSLIYNELLLLSTWRKSVLRKDFKDRSDILELINFNECKVFEATLGQHNMITTVPKRTS